MGGRGKLLDLRRTVNDVVERLADNRAFDAELIGETCQLGDAPAAKIRDAVVAQLALPDQVSDRAHAFFERRIGQRAVKVQDVDVIGAEPLQAGFHRLDDPLARLALLVRPAAAHIAELGGHDPAVATVRNGAPDDLLRAACVVDVGRVDKIDALLESLADDALGGRLVGLAAEHHRAEA